MAFAPLQPPDAVHDVAPVDDHVNLLEPPLATVVGVAVSVVTGAAGGAVVVTSTAVAEVVVPPRPVQLRSKDWRVWSGPIVSVPSVAFLPFQSPDALQRNAP